jgi:hypothetical protein
VRVVRSLAGCLAVAACAGLAACDRARPAGPLDVVYVLKSPAGAPAGGDGGVFRVTGLSSRELASLVTLSDREWPRLLRVGVVGQDGPPMAGSYSIDRDAVQFRPAFPLDPGRRYLVRFEPGRLPVPRADAPIEKTVALPAAEAAPSTFVTGLWPAASQWPENILRFYIHFSAPMSHTGSVGRVRLEDEQGREVADVFLPMELDLWNSDYTRCTVFFDPGRVKRGIRPNRELGRALVAGRRYAIVVDADWRDGQGQPLSRGFRHEFTAGPELAGAIDPGAWRIHPPQAGTFEPLAVEFPWPLDRALLRRTVGAVRRGSSALLWLGGTIEVDQDDRRWRLTPERAWTPGDYDLVVLGALEDPAGNAVGRAFEIDAFTRAPDTPSAADVTLPFVIR